MSSSPKNKNLSLKITAKTWLKETEDLYDLEAENVERKEMVIEGQEEEKMLISYKELNENLNLEIVSPQKLINKLNTNKNLKVLCVLSFSPPSSYLIQNSYKEKTFYPSSSCGRVWSLSPKFEYTKIEEGDVIKIGKIRLKFSKIFFKDEMDEEDSMAITGVRADNNISLTNNKLIQTMRTEGEFTISEIEKRQFFCRVCYNCESSIEDPLISPCTCSGSMTYIHLSCLKQSIKAKLVKKHEDAYDMYYTESYNCEICLTPYPKKIKYKDRQYNLIDIDLTGFTSGNYAICDVLHIKEKHESKYSGYIIFRFNENEEISIGRKQNNKIKLRDISVSRHHCIIIKKGNDLYIQDLGSKFGTLFYVKDKINLPLPSTLSLVSGKTLLTFSLSESWSFMSLFGSLSFGFCSCAGGNEEKGEFLIAKNKDKLKKEDKKKVNLEYMKFKEDDTYKDYIMVLDHIIGVKEDKDITEKIDALSKDNISESNNNI